MDIFIIPTGISSVSFMLNIFFNVIQSLLALLALQKYSNVQSSIYRFDDCCPAQV